MIIWAILIFWAPGVRSNHTADIVQLQTFQLGDDVTIKCFSTKKSIGNTLVWYKQSIWQMPQLIAISYSNWKNIELKDDFKNGRFSILSDEDSFHLKITTVTREDNGLYYCGVVFLNLMEFISGTHLMIKGTECKDHMACGEIPVANETSFKNTDSSQKAWNIVLCLISSNVVFVIVVITLLVNHCKHWRKRHRASTHLASSSCEMSDSDVNYAAVSFATVPPARRSEDNHLAEYSEVNLKLRDHNLFMK